MIFWLEGEEPVEFLLVPTIPHNHFKFPHASSWEINIIHYFITRIQNLNIGLSLWRGEAIVWFTQVNVILSPSFIILTYWLIIYPFHHKPPERLPGQNKARTASKIALIIAKVYEESLREAASGLRNCPFSLFCLRSRPIYLNVVS